MKRREFIALAGGAAAWPVVARAQQPAMPVIGFLSSRSPAESADSVSAFRQGLREAGFIEGQNLLIAFRWAEGRYDRLRELAADLVGLRVAILFAAGGSPSALAAKAATSTIPIVFSASNDPVSLGLVSSLSRPGGNITGMSAFNSELGPKRLELLKELVPTATTIAYLANPTNPIAEAELKAALQWRLRSRSSFMSFTPARITNWTEFLPLSGSFTLMGWSLLANRSSTASVTDLSHYPHKMQLLRATLGANTSRLAA
jgi:putative tryptophan/tyrosine transport system substrate-binding protein